MTAAPIKKPQRISDWLNRPQVERPDALEKRIELWTALNKYVSDNGGWVVSIPGKKLVRVELPLGSSLPARLAEFGYTATHCTISTRLHRGTIMPVDVFQLSLPER